MAVQADPHRRASFPCLPLQNGYATEIDQASVRRLDAEDPQLPRKTLSGNGNVDAPCAKLHSVLDVDVVRTIDPRDHLADLTVHTEGDDGAGRRGDLHRAEDEAARWILGVHPDCGIVGIVGERGRRIFGLDFQRLRQRRRRRWRFCRILVRCRRRVPASGRSAESDERHSQREQGERLPWHAAQNLNFSPS
jgi:hypothetical protein